MSARLNARCRLMLVADAILVSNGLRWRVNGMHVTDRRRRTDERMTELHSAPSLKAAHRHNHESDPLTTPKSVTNNLPPLSISAACPCQSPQSLSLDPSVSFHLPFPACPHRTVAPIPCRISTPDPWHHGAEALPEAVVPRILEALLANLKLPPTQTHPRCSSTMPLTNRASWAI